MTRINGKQRAFFLQKSFENSARRYYDNPGHQDKNKITMCEYEEKKKNFAIESSPVRSLSRKSTSCAGRRSSYKERNNAFTLRLVRTRLSATVLVVPVQLDDDLVVPFVGLRTTSADVGR